MKVKSLVEQYNFKPLTGDVALDREITQVDSCDLLSWVMANGKEGYAWITVQIHSNIIAVATLLDFACIIIPHNIEIEESVVAKAVEEEISILSTDMGPYDIFKCFFEEEMRG